MWDIVVLVLLYYTLKLKSKKSEATNVRKKKLDYSYRIIIDEILYILKKSDQKMMYSFFSTVSVFTNWAKITNSR